ncbi:MAG: hypothetical protein HYT21_01335 [Candidatus Nealsonbacteria bacterium]|nr:hypothetical protein [Candidatus Nealsonbacteria bacterium]
MTPKQKFLDEHNKLSPEHLQATNAMLSRFRVERTALFRDNNWSVDRLRRPFILWIMALTATEKNDINNKKN